MGYTEDVLNCQSLQSLFTVWIKKTPTRNINHNTNGFIIDGIVDFATWNSGKKKKVLFVLKEAYGDDWGEDTLVTWLHKYPKRRMWDRVARVVYGIQNTTESELKRYKPELDDSEFKGSLDQIAVLNLKKSNGKSYSDYDDIEEYAAYDREEIKREIELIDPEIVVCGSTFKTLYEIVYEQKKMPQEDKCDNWYYFLNLPKEGRERLYIDYYHPAIHDADLMYYYGLVGIYQQALIKKSNIV